MPLNTANGRSQYEYPAALESTIEAQIKHFAALIYKDLLIATLRGSIFYWKAT